jgi:hypothetical protein
MHLVEYVAECVTYQEFSIRYEVIIMDKETDAQVEDLVGNMCQLVMPMVELSSGDITVWIGKGKCKVVPVLFLTEQYAMKAYWEWRCSSTH